MSIRCHAENKGGLKEKCAVGSGQFKIKGKQQEGNSDEFIFTAFLLFLVLFSTAHCLLHTFFMQRADAACVAGRGSAEEFVAACGDLAIKDASESGEWPD